MEQERQADIRAWSTQAQAEINVRQHAYNTYIDMVKREYDEKIERQKELEREERRLAEEKKRELEAEKERQRNAIQQMLDNYSSAINNLRDRLKNVIYDLAENPNKGNTRANQIQTLSDYQTYKTKLDRLVALNDVKNAKEIEFLTQRVLRLGTRIGSFGDDYRGAVIGDLERLRQSLPEDVQRVAIVNDETAPIANKMLEILAKSEDSDDEKTRLFHRILDELEAINAKTKDEV